MSRSLLVVDLVLCSVVRVFYVVPAWLLFVGVILEVCMVPVLVLTAVLIKSVFFNIFIDLIL